MASSKQPPKRGADTPAPERGLDVPAPLPPTYEPSHVMQLLVEIQRELSSNTAKVDRLISDVGGLNTKVGSLDTSFSWAKGFAVCALLLIPISAGIVWWLVGDQINDMKRQLLDTRAPPSITAPAPPS